MKVVYVFRSLAIRGGIERIIVDKANHLADIDGYDVSIITADQGTHPVPYAVKPSVRVEDLNVCIHRQYQHRGLVRLWKGWSLCRLFVRVLRHRLTELQPDVVVCVATDYVDLVVKAVGTRVPIVVESHSNYDRTFGQHQFMRTYYDRQLRRSLSRARAIVALTETDAEAWRRHYDNVRYIPNMVNMNPTERRAAPEHRRVIFVGRLDYQKRAWLAIDIWQQIAAEFPDWELHVYGDGEQRDMIREQVDCTPRVVLHQPTDKIFEAYCDSSFFILTSVYEPFGLVMPEAMSCGLPVVAFDCPYGPRSIITDGTDGFLINEGDSVTFAERMRQLMSSPSLCRKMGDAAIVSAKRFMAPNIVPQWQQLFNEVTTQC